MSRLTLTTEHPWRKAECFKKKKESTQTGICHGSSLSIIMWPALKPDKAISCFFLFIYSKQDQNYIKLYWRGKVFWDSKSSNKYGNSL